MACDSLMTTSLLMSTDLLQVDCLNLLSAGLLQFVSTSYNKSATDKLQQAGKIDNLQQVYDVFGCYLFCSQKVDFQNDSIFFSQVTNWCLYIAGLLQLDEVTMNTLQQVCGVIGSVDECQTYILS